MEFTIHNQVLAAVFIIAMILGAVVNKTNFCAMGAVSDWVNIGDTGRLRAWLFAMAVAVVGVLIMEWQRAVSLEGVFPPYRTPNLMWLRYVLGGFLFGVGMTLASGCGNKTLVRIGGGNIKSLIVLAVAGFFAWVMLWAEDPLNPGEGIYNSYFAPWISPTIIDLTQWGMNSQQLDSLVAALTGVEATVLLHLSVGAALAAVLLLIAFGSKDFRSSFDHILGGAIVGLAVLGGWWVTGGSLGQRWSEWAEFATEVPSRVGPQSYTFISPMSDSVKFLLDFGNPNLINFGIMSLIGIILGSFIFALFTRSFRVEWFADAADFVRHAAGGALMGVGGVLAFGCTIGQGVTGVSTLAIGSLFAVGSIIFGSALTLKIQYYRLDDAGFLRALREALADLRLLPRRAAR